MKITLKSVKDLLDRDLSPDNYRCISIHHGISIEIVFYDDGSLNRVYVRTNHDSIYFPNVKTVKQLKQLIYFLGNEKFN